MGAKHRAQHRAKQNKESSKGSPWSQKKSNSSLQVHDLNPSLRHRALLQGWHDFADSSSPPSRNGFSMTEEARNTERQPFGFGNTKLRDNAVAFVSAGNLTWDRPEKTEEPKEPSEKHGVSEESSVPVTSDTDLQQTSVAIGNGKLPQNLDQLETKLAPSNSPVIDEKPIPYRQRATSVSSSSSDEIIFAGRQKPVVHQRRKSRELTNNGSLLNQSLPLASTPTENKDQPSSKPISNLSSSVEKHIDTKIRKPLIRNKNSSRKQRQKVLDDEEDAIIQDYIANMAMSDDDNDEEEKDGEESNGQVNLPSRRNEHYRYFDGAASTHVKVQTKSSKSVQLPSSLVDQAADWTSDDLNDFDGLDTSDDEISEVGQVLRYRQRLGVPQYLVTAIGKGASDAKWLPHDKLTSNTAIEEIRIFEEIQTMRFEEGSVDSDDDSESDEDALNDLLEDIESEDDENARILAHTARMTDEQIARALAKQEELGLGSDELMLFDGHFDDDEDNDRYQQQRKLSDKEFSDGNDFIPFSIKKHVSNRVKSKKNHRQRDSFPSAGAFADALDEDPYGAFDIMDFDRPSLRPRRKGRKSDFPFDLDAEDQEFVEQLQNTWFKDREKKIARKREKEEARQNAMFEASERSEPAVVKAEIRRFLMQESDTLKLAPMDAPTRASVHRLAKALKLNSRSEGKDGQGAGRYPVLTKTVYTPHYSFDNIWEVDALLNQRKFFPKFGGGSYKGSKAPKTVGSGRARRTGGGGVMAGATYMNGEVVGASAPELGSDNRGRAMLEKMGWTSGMGIGAVGNKGSVEVIKHVVKTTKAGLG